MNEIMHAIVLTGPGQVEIQEFPMIPSPDPDKLLIRTEYCALCTYEQRIFSGVHKTEFPCIMGHEVSGYVVEVGKDLLDKGWNVGDKVVVGSDLPCGSCYYCRTGDSQSCPHFNSDQTLPGSPLPGSAALQEYLMEGPHSVFRYYDVSAEEACLIEPISCVLHSVESAEPQYGDYAVIIGAGMMGQLHMQLANLKGCITIVVDMNKDRLRLAKELGADYVIDPSDEDALAKVMEYTHQLGAGIVFDTTPIAEVAKDSLKYLSYNGRLVIYSGIYPNKPMEVDPHEVHKKALRIIGTANSNERDFIRSSKLLSHGKINVRPFIEEIFDAKDCQKAFETAPGRFRNLIRLNF
ncbi:MAG: zinc-binding dehydrogenase [Erysipelotrichaceae bacterium]|nr:zinc-binding dehydrogenase [Erysipelotrichaceae bacterium]